MENTYTTHDLSVAAYLLMRKQKIIAAEKAPSGKYIFKFEDSEKQCQKLSIEFLSSECCAYDGFLRTLRGLLSQH